MPTFEKRAGAERQERIFDRFLSSRVTLFPNDLILFRGDEREQTDEKVAGRADVAADPVTVPGKPQLRDSH